MQTFIDVLPVIVVVALVGFSYYWSNRKKTPRKAGTSRAWYQISFGPTGEQVYKLFYVLIIGGGWIASVILLVSAIKTAYELSSYGELTTGTVVASVDTRQDHSTLGGYRTTDATFAEVQYLDSHKAYIEVKRKDDLPIGTLVNVLYSVRDLDNAQINRNREISFWSVVDGERSTGGIAGFVMMCILSIGGCLIFRRPIQNSISYLRKTIIRQTENRETLK